MHLHLTEVSDRHCLHVDIPQLQSAPTLTTTTNINATMVSWSPTEFSPKSYTILHSCQLICGSSETQQTMITVNGSLTTKIIMTDPGSSCVFYLTAEFGNSIVSNIVISSTNTTSAGRIYNTIVISWM